MNSESKIKLQIGDLVRGKYSLTLLHDDKVLHASYVDPHMPKEIDGFVAAAKVKAPKIPSSRLRKQLLQLAVTQTKAAGSANSDEDVEYDDSTGCIIWFKPERKGPIPVTLTNFTAHISTDIVRDDGAEREHRFEITAKLGDKTHRFTISSDEFMEMSWPIQHLGAGAIIEPGASLRGRTPVAIQKLSADLQQREIFAHTGWREIDDQYVYLHAGGAIGRKGVIDNIEVELDGSSAKFTLPPPPTVGELTACISSCLGFLDLASPEITFPLMSAVWRAPLGACDFSVHIAGATGVFKSEISALLQQHFGAAMDARHLPGSWSSTDNALEGLAFAVKDTLMVVDDFAPTGTVNDVQRYHVRADRVIRAAGNHSGRGRMRPDGSLRPVKPPRCLLLSTGEDIPRGQSLRARMLIIELSASDINKAQLTTLQQHASQGHLAGAMAGYVKWLASRIGKLQKQLPGQIAKYRQQAANSVMHARTPDLTANLLFGFKGFLSFAREVGAISAVEQTQLLQRCWEALGKVAARQTVYQASAEPAARFIELLVSALGSGACHLAAPDGRSAPKPASAWGWVQQLQFGTSNDFVWGPRGTKIGWVDENFIYLLPDASFKAVQGVAGGDGLSITPHILRKRLFERGYLVRDEARKELTMRKVHEGAERAVLMLKRVRLPIGVPCAHKIECGEPVAPPAKGGTSGTGNNGAITGITGNNGNGGNGTHANGKARAAGENHASKGPGTESESAVSDAEDREFEAAQQRYFYPRRALPPAPADESGVLVVPSAAPVAQPSMLESYDYFGKESAAIPRTLVGKAPMAPAAPKALQKATTGSKGAMGNKGQKINKNGHNAHVKASKTAKAHDHTHEHQHDHDAQEVAHAVGQEV